MRPLTMTAWALLVAIPLALADDPEPPNPKAGKQNGSLKVRLVAKQKTYTLDRQGMTAAEYRKAILAGKVAAPAVDLVLELTNTSKDPVQVRVEGASPTFTFKLTGPKGSVVNYAPGFKGKGVVKKRVKMVVIPPGKNHEIQITTLDSTDVSYPRNAAFWTEPGEHRLSVDFRTLVQDKAGLKGKGGGRLGPLSSQEVKLTVKLK